MRTIVWTALFTMAAAGAAVAQTTAPGLTQPQQPGYTHPPMPGMQQGAMTPSTQAYETAMQKMGEAMMQPMTGDADKDFVSGMIVHHQGAIDMAKVELEYGRDAALKKLARDIIAAQEKEIAFMRGWQAKHAK